MPIFQGFFHVLQLEGLNNGFDFLHGFPFIKMDDRLRFYTISLRRNCDPAGLRFEIVRLFAVHAQVQPFDLFFA